MTGTTFMSSPAMTRWRASGIQFATSVAIAAGTLWLVFGVWYPPPLFTAEGAGDILLVLVAVDLVVGALITLIVFRPGKPGLRHDLTVTSLVRVAALVYGLHVLLIARPVYIALIGEQFETVRANDIDPADLARAPNPAYRSLPLSGPVFVSVEMPSDLKELNELIAQALRGGTQAQHLPRYFAPYSSRRESALARGRPAEMLRDLAAGGSETMEQQITETGYPLSRLKFLLLQTRRGWGAVLIDAETGDIVKLLPPWKS